jgi:hypothetical protein
MSYVYWCVGVMVQNTKTFGKRGFVSLAEGGALKGGRQWADILLVYGLFGQGSGAVLL